MAITAATAAPHPGTARIAALLLACAMPCASEARIVEHVEWFPASALDARGREVSRDIRLTVFYDDAAPQPYPLLVLNHGRAGKRVDREALGRATYQPVSHWLAARGFLVVVPTRIGYGVTGGPDVEDTGSCGKKVYPPGYAASAAQTMAVIAHLRGWKEVAKDRTVVMGQSFGGTTAITIAAMNPPGIQAAVNFAGGGGGNPVDRPGNPCGQPQLKRLFADYGKTARIPTLWIYAKNDQFMGPRLPRAWFDAFRESGGVGEFVEYPPFGADGHGLFNKSPETWQPRVLEFLRANGYPHLR